VGDETVSVLRKLGEALGLRQHGRDLVSVVLYFRKGFVLTDDVLHAAVVRAWKRDVDETLKEYVMNMPPICFVKFDGMILLLTNVNKQYCNPENLEQAVAEFPELRQKKVVREHRAFLAIDLQLPKEGLTKSVKSKCYKRMCSLAAEFVDDNCLGVYLPEFRHLRPYDSEIISALRDHQPLKEIYKWGDPA
jgi:hypothetical protein